MATAVVGLYVALGVCLVGGAFVIGNINTSKVSVDELRKEADERKDSTCVTFESQYNEEVQRLANTYHYLNSIPRSELTTSFNRVVIAQLPKIEADARTDRDHLGVFVPAFCNRPHVGLPEPPPRVPPKPAFLTKRFP